jgi:uncharacterized protein YigE (DUF2233 family)
MFTKIRISVFLILLFSIGTPLAIKAQILQQDMISFVPEGKQKVRLYWKDDQGKLLGSLGKLKTFAEQRRQRLVFAMNGGMYLEDRAPLGLFIQEGKTIRSLNKAKGSGNFFLQPNGVFYINSSGKGAVCKTADFRNKKDIRYATQSGPMLVINGSIHLAFKKGSTNLNIRNGVGILPDGRMLFAMSKKEVSLYDFAAYFKNKGCRNALYLDGFVSRTYYPAINWKQLDGYFGVMIGVVEY